MFIALVSVIGYKAKAQQNLTHYYKMKSIAYYNQVQELKTYKQPTIDLQGKDKAIYIIRKIWRKDWKVGVAIASCESGFREKVIGVTHDVGYFQINPIHGFSDEEMQNGLANVGFAYSLYKEQGTTPWNSSKSCWIERL
jgi:hypothetical protein